ncbi:hypothetical protein ACNOYE_26465 [Nannocystaceae bacterium ST9]
MRPPTLALALALLTSTACANNQAHLDWRPGLSAIDFNGLYELGFDEYREFRERGAANLLFDRWHGVGEPEASPAMQAIGERLRGASVGTPQELALVDLSSAGLASFVDARGRQSQAEVEWFAATPDREYAAMLAGPKLAVVIGGSSIGIDAGSLLGPGLGGWQFTMLVVGDELTLFALPELGGAAAPDEPGYVFEFGVAPQASRPWQVSVGRVSVRP